MKGSILLFSLSGLLSVVGGVRKTGCWNDPKTSRTFAMPNKALTRYLAQCLPGNGHSFQTVVSPLLVARVPGSSGNEAARTYIAATLENLGWTVEFDTFTQNTVIGQQTFSNIIATLHPNSPRRLVLSAHYDSKLTPTGFIGATDSAVPCAMLLDLATRMKDVLLPTSQVPAVTLQLIFFDGEEAFISWTATDSLYGSRHLASLWQNQSYTVASGLSFCQNGSATELDRIDAFLLLDLIGVAGPTFRNYSIFDGSLFAAAVQVETNLRKSGLCKSQQRLNSVFRTGTSASTIEDDHIPFYNLGLRRILHMISNPFPSVWHTMQDSGAALDYPTIDYINKLLRMYVFGYLNLPLTSAIRAAAKACKKKTICQTNSTVKSNRKKSG